MGTHLCALPAGEHRLWANCRHSAASGARRLSAPGVWSASAASSAQPKKSAAPIFRRMLTSHERGLDRGRVGGEPAGQLAARELEVQRIDGALRRADALDDDVAAAIEAAC